MEKIRILRIVDDSENSSNDEEINVLDDEAGL